MNATILQPMMDSIINLLYAAVALVLGGTLSIAIVKLAPQMSRWGYNSILNFFGFEKTTPFDSFEVERNGKVWHLPLEMMAHLQKQGYEVYEGSNKNQIYMRHKDTHANISMPSGLSDMDWESDDGFLEDDLKDDDFSSDNQYDFLSSSFEENINHYDFLRVDTVNDSTDDDDEPLSADDINRVSYAVDNDPFLRAGR